MNLNKLKYTLPLFIFFLLSTTGSGLAQETSKIYGETKKYESSLRSLKAIRLNTQNEVTLDGKLEEPIWQQAPTATDFIQRSPQEGKPATENTEVQIIYSDDALYVGICAYDSAMDSVAATLFRRDGSAYSDWVYVNIDSYNDNRTSFSFAVNPRAYERIS